MQQLEHITQPLHTRHQACAVSTHNVIRQGLCKPSSLVRASIASGARDQDIGRGGSLLFSLL
jgi:hypothetical protein